MTWDIIEFIQKLQITFFQEDDPKKLHKRHIQTEQKVTLKATPTSVAIKCCDIPQDC